MPSVCIIGGGLGGLALARFLKTRGVKAVVYEREAEDASDDALATGQGYALGLTPETIERLRPLYAQTPSLRAALEVKGNEHAQITLHDADGTMLLSMEIHGRFVDRPALRCALAEGVDVRSGAAFASYEAGEDGMITARFQDGTSAGPFGALVGCDGARSAVRLQCAPALRWEDLGLTQISGSMPHSSAPHRARALCRHGLARVLARDGFTMMLMQYHAHGEHTLLWALGFHGAQGEWRTRFAAPEEEVEEEYARGGGKDKSIRRIELRNWLEGEVETRFDPFFAEMIAATPPDNLFGPRQIRSVTPAAVRASASQTAAALSRVTLLGDAAHATTSHMGAGGNAAFADAEALAEALASAPPEQWPEALRRYEAQMWPRGERVVRSSRTMTWLIHARGWLAYHLRKWALRAMSAGQLLGGGRVLEKRIATARSSL